MKIVLIGTGNVATHLGPALQKAGHEIVQLVGRNHKNTIRLAAKLNCPYTTDTSAINSSAKIYLLCIKDEALKSFSKVLPDTKGLVLHTSGSVDAGIVFRRFFNYGVIYPLQTFSAGRKIKFSEVPLCLEANNKNSQKGLKKLAASLSDSLYWTDYDQRLTLHLAAVFANNFSNHLFSIAADLLSKKNLKFDILRPLILETAEKVQSHLPSEMQTGPARRGDSLTLEKHMLLLKKNPRAKSIYKQLTNSILDHDGPRL